MSRKPISKKLRFDVFKRDGFQCAYCGAHPSETVVLEVDHIQPVACGGGDEIDNLVTACFACNRGKRDVPLSAIPHSIAEKTELIAEREAQIHAYHEVLAWRRQRRQEELDAVIDIYIAEFGRDEMTGQRISSIRMFLDRIDVFEVRESMELAVERKQYAHPAFKYFCGICWNKIKNAEGVRV